MSFLSAFPEAWRALQANRLRTWLTMLGVIIGVGAVVLMLSIGQGTQSSVNRAVASMGSNLFIVLSGATTSGGLRMGSGTVPTLTTADADAITKLPSIKVVAPVQPNSAQLAYGANNWGTLVAGVTREFFQARSWQPIIGDAFSDTDIRNANQVVLLGQTVATNLFGDEDPLGKVIRIKNKPFQVVGIMDPKGQSLDGRDQDDTVFVPLTTAQNRLFGNPFPGTVRFMLVQTKSNELMDEAEIDINALLRQRHRIQPGSDNDFTVRNLTSVAQAAAGAARALSLMLGTIGSISLLVGGIGIMNIMLVSVTERTREIGIRMAVGARRRDILWQFLLEAIVICVIGGLVGLALGVGSAWLASESLGMEAEISLSSMLLAFSVAAATGIFFGFYPARRAAHLKPVEALRYE
jgi:putative ABC transport system permease protein